MKGTSVTHADYARTARGEAMPKLDMKHYEVAQGVLQSHDINQIIAATSKLELASEYDAIPIDASRADAVGEIRKLTKGRGVNVSVEMIGLRKTMEQAIDSLGNLGRAVMVGLNQQPISINTYAQVLGKEAEIIGSNDHLLSELPLLVEWARRGILDTSRVVSQVISLDAGKINQRLDDLEKFTSDVRVVITP